MKYHQLLDPPEKWGHRETTVPQTGEMGEYRESQLNTAETYEQKSSREALSG